MEVVASEVKVRMVILGWGHRVDSKGIMRSRSDQPCQVSPLPSVIWKDPTAEVRLLASLGPLQEKPQIEPPAAAGSPGKPGAC